MAGEGGYLSAKSAEFVPGSRNYTTPGAQVNDEEDVVAGLPAVHRQMLRGAQLDVASGQLIPYYVGRLKSFSSQSGFGFLQCAQSLKQYGCDVFIHKHFVPKPWHTGQAVEFAVTINARGQPQACDVLWLPWSPPRVAKPLNRFGAGPAIVSVGGCGCGGPAGNAAAAAAAEAENLKAAANAAASKERFFGTLKSFSNAHGYGFVACEDTQQRFSRDVYIDRSQLREGAFMLGQVLEFGIQVNAKQQPQAKDVVWDPVPYVTPAAVGQTRPAPSSAALKQLRKISKLCVDGEYEMAVVAAIDLQGGQASLNSNLREGGTELDFVAFLIDRLPDSPAEVIGKLKQFVRMLLLLMLAKMLRRRRDDRRTRQLLTWFAEASRTMNPQAPEVQDHFGDVAPQILGHLKAALREAPAPGPPGLTDEGQKPLAELLTQALKDFQAKTGPNAGGAGSAAQ
eukprot:TRINITY_DN36999_c0_g1_i1.p1 TRINITY_DN36999_c0_g1~~TRINITY_DN36999_c0_g1_i1.p1  ORF type:complete len:453 (+),score=103.85 TRINITY_DN36999_c0_g1_i1:98-1456(+)